MSEILQLIVVTQNLLKDEENLQHITKGMRQNIVDSRKNILECHLHHYLRKLIKPLGGKDDERYSRNFGINSKRVTEIKQREG